MSEAFSFGNTMQHPEECFACLLQQLRMLTMLPAELLVMLFAELLMMLPAELLQTPSLKPLVD